jgi:hypothetical protein
MPFVVQRLFSVEPFVSFEITYPKSKPACLPADRPKAAVFGVSAFQPSQNGTIIELISKTYLVCGRPDRAIAGPTPARFSGEKLWQI